MQPVSWPTHSTLRTLTTTRGTHLSGTFVCLIENNSDDKISAPATVPRQLRRQTIKSTLPQPTAPSPELLSSVITRHQLTVVRNSQRIAVTVQNTMGLKLRWFRRRITFDGIPSAPERSIRRKEATSGTVIGVYRHSSHFEDYIEPVRSSYWEPPPQAIARATIRTSNPSTTSTNSPSSSSATSNGRSRPMTMKAHHDSAPPTLPVPTTISSVSRSANVVVVRSPVIDRKPDKIESSTAERVDSTRLSNGMHLETPPEPTYTPPLPPARKGLGKAKSLASLAPAATSTAQDFDRMPPSDESGDSDIYGYVVTSATDSQLRSTQSVEVLTSISPPKGSSPSSPTASPVVAPIPRTRSTTSLTQVNRTSSPSLSSLSSTTSTVLEGENPRSPRVNKVLAASNESPSESEEPFQTIFERVKPRSKLESPPPERDDSPPATPTLPPQRQPVLVVSPTSSAQPSPPHQPKSILKKRAPAPPPLEATSEIAFKPMPTAPPRTIRSLDVSNSDYSSPKPLETPEVQNFPEKHITATPNDDDNDDDDDFNWDFVQRHRSSINQTVAAQTQIDPEVLRNAPAALKQPLQAIAPVNRSPVEPIAQPRTLRGMRNQRARPQETRDWSAEPRAGMTGQETHQGRASDSNASETSA
ncbi:flocculation protein FLO11-like [Anopheles albimanus]|uniref:flocculation protein FLO11-like n=1 Tax=Anopheles albimanus TaxID=7167 RepID=UPI00163FCD4A|nr:flocculation protein FLO11-like [Anopheles albimanus]